MKIHTHLTFVIDSTSRLCFVIVPIPHRPEIAQRDSWKLVVNICSIREEDNNLEFQNGHVLPSI